MTIANTILQQLGGRQFIAMTGAKNLLDGGSYLQIDVPSALTKDRANKVRVTLTPSDTYTVETLKFSRKTLACAVVAAASNVYADNLRATFTDLTGLDTSL